MMGEIAGAGLLGFALGAVWMRWFLREQLQDVQNAVDALAETIGDLLKKDRRK